MKGAWLELLTNERKVDKELKGQGAADDRPLPKAPWRHHGSRDRGLGVLDRSIREFEPAGLRDRGERRTDPRGQDRKTRRIPRVQDVVEKVLENATVGATPDGKLGHPAPVNVVEPFLERLHGPVCVERSTTMAGCWKAKR